jgi:hypothetical protein
VMATMGRVPILLQNRNTNPSATLFR